MILSHEHRFVFIKGIKVGGTSAEIALSQICGVGDIVTPIMPADERYRLGTAGEPRNYATHLYPPPIRRQVERRYVQNIRDASPERLASIRLPRSRFYNHMPLSRVLQLVPQAQQYELLFVERSPYAKVLSLANWSRNESAYRRGATADNSASQVAAEVDRLIDEDKITRVLNISRYRDFDGRIDSPPWKTTSLGEDIARFFEARGLAAPSVVNAKKGLRSEKHEPATVLKAHQINVINELFAEEFAFFGWPIIKP
ncbi:MAG TPA: hypothetical protein VFW39_10710 [Sphingomicrobium sp.]|nr:hypothetical protein [Sphingomicrobium sp.]